MKSAQTRRDRQNKAKQLQIKKRQELLAATRAFCGVDGVPRVVAVVPLSEDVSAVDVAKALAGAVGVEDQSEPGCSSGSWKVP